MVLLNEPNSQIIIPRQHGAALYRYGWRPPRPGDCSTTCWPTRRWPGLPRHHPGLSGRLSAQRDWAGALAAPWTRRKASISNWVIRMPEHACWRSGQHLQGTGRSSWHRATADHPAAAGSQQQGVAGQPAGRSGTLSRGLPGAQRIRERLQAALQPDPESACCRLPGRDGPGPQRGQQPATQQENESKRQQLLHQQQAPATTS